MSSLQSDIVTYQTEMELFGARIGENPYSINPYQRKAMENLDEIPQPNSDVAAYLNWAANQDPKADTSIDAYITYLEEKEAGIGGAVQSTSPPA